MTILRKKSQGIHTGWYFKGPTIYLDAQSTDEEFE